MLSYYELLDDESLSLVARPVAVPCWAHLPLAPPLCPGSPRMPTLGVVHACRGGHMIDIKHIK